MKVLLLGGSKSGKSGLAQDMACELSGGSRKVYWAAMEPVDCEDEARIEKHVKDREGLGFETLECGRNIASKKSAVEGKTVLFDSLTALLANEMFTGKCFDLDARERVLSGIAVVSSASEHFICVCDEVFNDGFVFDGMTEEYRRGLAYICRSLAEPFDAVAEVTAGIPKFFKGGYPAREV
ncbi:MAG: bifunctional adenosylcobinamide kinase/adenosylcobinamide-phosphate guanylyltransferase [Clostridia bacterium]|nr:bifunctional adenosylcobinamide kinase/adenosylcobinamide-phosphate guanylyltransferase [Clostridia bacterium]